MNFTMMMMDDDDDMTQLDYAAIQQPPTFPVNSCLQGMARIGKRAASSDAETEDSGFESSLSPPFAKNMKTDDESSPLTGTHWPFTFADRRSAFAPSMNENCKFIENIRFQPFSGKYSSRSRDGRSELRILSQPEEQHRARYMTEGSRGAIKDMSGLGHPCIKLTGVHVPVRVDCFIGHDKHVGLPHLFYQASRINGKNSTRCTSTKIDGTTVISFDLLPENNMHATVDCVGILKERNVDVEHKLQRLKNKGDVFLMTKKRSTRCRIVFRCELPDTKEVLMVVSGPILCTQPAGCPEIAKKSLSESDVTGGNELFIIGKNFVKESKVVWKSCNWMKIVDPNKEFLHSTHIVCTIPAYDGPEQQGNVQASVFVKNSDGKESECHAFLYKRKSMIAPPALASNDSLSTGHGLPEDLVGTRAVTHCPPVISSFVTSGSQLVHTATGPNSSSAVITTQELERSQNMLPVQTLFSPSCSDFRSVQGTASITTQTTCSQANTSFPSTSFDPNSAPTQSFPVPNNNQQSVCPVAPQTEFISQNNLNNNNSGQMTNSQQTLQSINAMSQMSENELLWVINPSTFEQCLS